MGANVSVINENYNSKWAEILWGQYKGKVGVLMDANKVSEKTGIKGKVLQEIIDLAKKIMLKK